jgi:hypothetical protein
MLKRSAGAAALSSERTLRDDPARRPALSLDEHAEDAARAVAMRFHSVELAPGRG